MTFLNPAVLIGLLAGIIPIALHFINLKKIKKIDFSTLYFMEELRKSKIRKLKFRQWLLLLLRLLIIIFLVLAFAKPAVEKGWGIAGEKAKLTAMFIVDDSPSMSAQTENGSAFNEAKSAIKQIASRFANDDDLYLQVLSASGKKFVKLNRSSMLKLLPSLSVTDVHSSLSNEIIRGINFIAGAKTLNKELFVFSDFQKADFDSAAVKKALGKQTSVHVYFLPVKGIVKHDFSVSSFELKTKLISKTAPLEFSARVKNSGSSREENQISLFINQKRVAQSSAVFQKGESKKISLRTNLSQTGFVTASVTLGDDDLLFNNKAFLSFYVKPQRKILLVSPDGEELKFVNLALSAAGISNIVKSITYSKLDFVNLSDYDAVFAAGLPGKYFKRIKDYINSGGGLIVFPAGKSIGSFETLLKKFAIGKYYGVSNNRNAIPILFDKVNLSDPIFEGLFKNKRNVKISSPKIVKYIKMKAAGSGRTLISLEDKSAFLARYKFGRGRVFVFNVSPAMDWSDFPVTPIFAPLMNRIVLYLTSSGNTAEPVYAGSEYKIRRSIFSDGAVKVVTPNGKEIIINSDELKNRNFYIFKATDFSGIYRIFSMKKLTGEFAVNVNPVESELKYFSSKELRSMFASGENGKRIKIIPQGKNYSDLLLLQGEGSELWRLFLLLALIFALLEMLAARTSRKEFVNFTGK